MWPTDRKKKDTGQRSRKNVKIYLSTLDITPPKRSQQKTCLIFRSGTCARLAQCPPPPLLCVLSPSLVILHFMPLSFPVLPRWDGAHTKPFSLPPRRAFPPRSLPGIPESILAIENVKNEGRAGEGARSAAAGRVLSCFSRGTKSQQVTPEYQRPYSTIQSAAVQTSIPSTRWRLRIPKSDGKVVPGTYWGWQRMGRIRKVPLSCQRQTLTFSPTTL